MEITFFVKDGHVALKCEGLFLRPVEKVLLDRTTGLLSVQLLGKEEKVELDCPLCPETIDAIGDHGFCGMGFYHHGKMLGAEIYPLEKR